MLSFLKRKKILLPEVGQIEVAGILIYYSIHRSVKRKRSISLSLDQTKINLNQHHVRILAPRRVSTSSVQNLIIEKAATTTNIIDVTE
jgi:hypothetical protein